ncbi:3234_t:CDS:1, partial [Gigaspora rosea]
AERILYTWVIEQRKQALAITYTTLQNKIAEILQQPDMLCLYSNLAKNFKASYHWLVAFIKRNVFALRQHTKTAQKLPKENQRM